MRQTSERRMARKRGAPVRAAHALPFINPGHDFIGHATKSAEDLGYLSHEKAAERGLLGKEDIKILCRERGWDDMQMFETRNLKYPPRLYKNRWLRKISLDREGDSYYDSREFWFWVAMWEDYRLNHPMYQRPRTTSTEASSRAEALARHRENEPARLTAPEVSQAISTDYSANVENLRNTLMQVPEEQRPQWWKDYMKRTEEGEVD